MITSIIQKTQEKLDRLTISKKYDSESVHQRKFKELIQSNKDSITHTNSDADINSLSAQVKALLKGKY